MSRDHNARSRLLRYIFGIQIPTVHPTFNVQDKKVFKNLDLKRITFLFWNKINVTVGLYEMQRRKWFLTWLASYKFKTELNYS